MFCPSINFDVPAFAMNATDHINVVFRKFAYSLISRVTTSTNRIVTAIVNGDAYHQSPPTANCMGEYVICIGIIIGRKNFENVNV